MELLTPGFGLMIFQILVLISILSFITSWTIILLSNRIEPVKKLIWLIGTLLLPIIGPVLLFISLRSFKKEVL